MTIRKPFSYRGLIEMSWAPHNLYNLFSYSKAGAEKEISRTEFQSRWRAKQLTIPYHAGHLTQHQFRKMHQKNLPSLARPEAKKALELPHAPTVMLTFAFLERHLDVVLFRSCFVPSIWRARKLVSIGHVTVNGKRVRVPNYILEDGDIVQVTRIERMELVKKPEIKLGNDDTEPSKDDAENEASTETNSSKTEATVSSDSPLRLSKEQWKVLNKKMKNEKYPTSDEGLEPMPFMAPWLFVPEYLEVNYNNMSVCFLRTPKIGPGKCEIPSPFDEIIHQRAHDFYANFRGF